MAPDERAVPGIEALVLRVLHGGPALHRRVAAADHRGEAAHDVADLAFRVEDDAARMREVRAGPVQAEEVREARDRDAEVRLRLLAPLLAQRRAAAADHLHRPEVLR